MNDQIEINYGGRRLMLTKSENLVALRAKPGMEPQLESAVKASDHLVGSVGIRLAGFHLFNTDTQRTETNSQLDHLRADPAVDLGSHVFHTSSDGVPFVPTGALFVRFKSGSSANAREQLISNHHLQLSEARGEDEFILNVSRASENPVKVAAELQKADIVEIAEPDLATPAAIKQFMTPSDPLLREQWHLQNTGHHRGTSLGFVAGADARVIDGWNHAGTLGNADTIIAVIDDGFDLTHPDLSGIGKVKEPWDFTRKSNKPVQDPTTLDWHGTACAGVATGAVNGVGVVGAAPGATLMPIRWGVNLSDKEIEDWFGYVTEKQASVVSCSWGALAKHFALSTRAAEAIAKCAKNGRGGKGCVVVFAAGNDNHDINDPANGTVDGFAIHPDVIAVAASTSRDERANYSNFGDAIAVCAPSSGAGGWGILTSDVMGTYAVNGTNVHQGYDVSDFIYDFGGTSSACPLVAGVAALVLSVNPALSAPEVKSLLCRTARKIGKPSDYGPTGHSRVYGFGCVSAVNALSSI